MSLDATRYAKLVEQHGLSTAHRRALEWVPEGSRVLELGCSSGFIGSLMRDVSGCEVTGVEVDEAAAAEARAAGLSVVTGSLEEASFRESLLPEGELYDVVMAMDVLEHLSDPAVVFADFHRWLKPDGLAIVSVPNVAAWTMRADLMRGHFDYQETGLLDRTHLKFFTWDTFHALVQAPGWEVVDVCVDTWEVPLLQTALFNGPLAWRKSLEPALEEPGKGLGGALKRQLFHGAGRALQLHQRIGKTLGKRYPNLCARHISLLLRPPRP